MTFVTAELGTHWHGDLRTLYQMAKFCKLMGCNAVKLQSLSPEKISRHPELKYYESASVNPDNIDSIDHIMNTIGIEWYATVTYPDAVEFLDDYVNKYKISVADSTNEKIKDKVFGTGKTVIISTPKPFPHSDKRIKNLYCVPSYPTEWGEINFHMLSKFDGYSNHCKNPLAVLKAVLAGCEYIEFHLTPTRERFLIDNVVSFTIEEAFELMYWIKWSEVCNNNPSKAYKQQISD